MFCSTTHLTHTVFFANDSHSQCILTIKIDIKNYLAKIWEVSTSIKYEMYHFSNLSNSDCKIWISFYILWYCISFSFYYTDDPIPNLSSKKPDLQTLLREVFKGWGRICGRHLRRKQKKYNRMNSNRGDRGITWSMRTWKRENRNLPQDDAHSCTGDLWLQQRWAAIACFYPVQQTLQSHKSNLLVSTRMRRMFCDLSEPRLLISTHIHRCVIYNNRPIEKKLS